MKQLEMSAVIITRDDRERVTKLTKKLLEFLAEVVVLVDDRSEDGLLEELRRIEGCRAELNTFGGFGAAKQKVVSLAKYDWVFSLDADEIPDEKCIESVRGVDLSQPDIYKVKRLNHYCDRPIKACGWYPDEVIRIFHKSVANFSDEVVHESVKAFDSSHNIKLLEGDILHYSFYGSHQLMQKVLSYTSMYAENYQGKPKSAFLIVLRTIFGFFKSYILRKGIFYGRDGFVISVMNAAGVFNKHWRAAEKVREERKNC